MQSKATILLLWGRLGLDLMFGVGLDLMFGEILFTTAGEEGGERVVLLEKEDAEGLQFGMGKVDADVDARCCSHAAMIAFGLRGEKTCNEAVERENLAALIERVESLKMIADMAVKAIERARRVENDPPVALMRWEQVNTYLVEARDCVDDGRFIVRNQAARDAEK